MPKMKTHSSAKKRFKVTGGGHIKRHKAWKSHLLTKKAKNRKRRLNRTTFVKACDLTRVKLLLVM
ncbi:50S ribosomal protein L35 [Sphingobacteriales bacterium UPWRP_1]|nr:50S ribosomal protein L35 [Sphingobacteriales bacterium TSM_CSS]PSJ78760.1 50S ribosomal protein L35 [Sphingobacteriales bacterium UPWRP_1]